MKCYVRPFPTGPGVWTVDVQAKSHGGAGWEGDLLRERTYP